jgi:hypothetical protein
MTKYIYGAERALRDIVEDIYPKVYERYIRILEKKNQSSTYRKIGYI